MEEEDGSELKHRSFIALLKSYEVPLYNASEVSEDYREPAIVTGYRPEKSSTLTCVISVFRCTNETVNIWTHFLPSWYFLWRLLCFYRDFSHDSYNWPFLGYMFTACAYPFISCGAHVMSCLSVRARHICYFFDYMVLSIFSFGTGLLYRCYSFPEEFNNCLYADLFLPGCVVFSLLCTGMACYSRFSEGNQVKFLLRVGAYTIPYIWDNYPLVYRLLKCTDSACSVSLPYHLLQYLGMILGGLVYGSHFPECTAPGLFDFIGNSHNILHICGILATLAQMKAGMSDLSIQRYPLPVSGGISLISVLVVALLNIALVYVFISQLHLIVHDKDKSKKKIR